MAIRIIDGIAVEIDGDGPALLCIHGLGGSSNTWSTVMPALAGHKVIRVDLPGSARSELPDSPLSIAVYVAAIERVLAALEVDSVGILAHSMGTIVAQHFTVAHPGKVRSLILFGPLLAPPDAGRAGILARAQAARGGIVAMQGIADAIVAAATSKETKANNPVALAMVRESVMRQPPEGYAQSCEALAGAQPANVAAITAPTLLVTGDQDGVAPATAVQAMAAMIAGSRVTVLEGCGHWTTFEKAGECSAAIEEFYKQLR